MKRALIATVFNEADNIARWWDCLRSQTVLPDEIVIVDGGSSDGTWEKLRTVVRTLDVPVRLEQRCCNIAEGRNLAIHLTDAGIIASSDAGSFPEPDWFHEITGPLVADETLDVVGGLNVSAEDSEFLNYLSQFEVRQVTGVIAGKLHPSSRNTAFRRQSWSDVGGYPEWLTLAAEDALFTHELNMIGKRFSYNPRAVVRWMVRGSETAYYRLLYRNGYGAAEARLNPGYFLRRAAIALFPPLLLLSRHRFRHLGFRYLKNFSSARGWLAGRMLGRRPPKGWKRVKGVLLSPEALRKLSFKHHDCNSSRT